MGRLDLSHIGDVIDKFMDTLSGLFELVKLKGRISVPLNNKEILFAACN